MSFVLRKWYLDVTTADGSYLIFYLGQLTFKSLKVNFSHRLGGGRFADLSAPPKLRSHGNLEIGSDGKAVLEDRAAGLRGEWTPETPPSSHTLLASETGKVNWCCLQPSAQVQFCHEQTEHVGRGYVECLTMTLPPWELGLRYLDWGRYISDSDQVTWLRWSGDHSLELAIVNGEASHRVVVNENRVEAGDSTLELTSKQVIRDGMLGSTVLKKLPAILPLAPLQMLRLHERKWLSRGCLVGADGSQSTGWSIHETVEWPTPVTPV